MRLRSPELCIPMHPALHQALIRGLWRLILLCLAGSNAVCLIALPFFVFLFRSLPSSQERCSFPACRSWEVKMAALKENNNNSHIIIRCNST